MCYSAWCALFYPILRYLNTALVVNRHLGFRQGINVIQQNIRCEGQAWAELHLVSQKICSFRLLLHWSNLNGCVKQTPTPLAFNEKSSQITIQSFEIALFSIDKLAPPPIEWGFIRKSGHIEKLTRSEWHWKIDTIRWLMQSCINCQWRFSLDLMHYYQDQQQRILAPRGTNSR